MIKEILLPPNACFFRCIGFPLTNQFAHFLFISKRDERMQMIRHNENQVHIPTLTLVIESR